MKASRFARFSRCAVLTGALCTLGLGALQPVRAESVLERIGRTGRLNTLVMNDDLPYTSQQGNAYAGLAMEFALEIQQELSDFLGKPVTLTPQPTNTVEDGIAAIAAGNVDLACGVSFSWGRSMFIDYTLPFALSGTRLLTASTNNGTPDALAGQSVGVVNNSVAAQTIAQAAPGANLQRFDNPSAALTALKSGQVQLLAGDSLWLLATRQAAAPSGNVVPAVPYNRSGVGCTVPEDNSDLLDLSNLAIGRLMQAYINDDPKAQNRINRWVGPGSSVNLPTSAIKTYFTNVLLTAALLCTHRPT